MEPLDQDDGKGAGDQEGDSKRFWRNEVECPDGLNWGELAGELRSLFKFNKENRSWWIIVKTSLIIFATSFAPSFFDMGSDALSTYNFINGTTYTKYVPDLNHPSVNSSQCKHVGTHLRMDGNFSEVVYEEVECFEKDPIWGYMSLVFILTSGLGGGGVWNGLNKVRAGCLAFLTLPIFPLVVLAVKTVGVFNPGQNWKILARRCAFAEGIWESKYQFLLQLFIVFSRADRAPSAVQLATMASSVVMLAIISLDAARREQKTVELGDDVRRAIDIFPRILAYNVSSLGCMALLATLLRYWVLLPWTCVAIAECVWAVVIKCKPKYKEMSRDATRGRISVGLVEMNEWDVVRGLFVKIIWVILTLVLTGLTITANLHPSLKIPGLAWEEHHLSDLAIVEKIYLLNSIFAVTLAATILDAFLFFTKTWKPFWEAKAKAKAPKSLENITLLLQMRQFLTKLNQPKVF